MSANDELHFGPVWELDLADVLAACGAEADGVELSRRQARLVIRLLNRIGHVLDFELLGDREAWRQKMGELLEERFGEPGAD